MLEHFRCWFGKRAGIYTDYIYQGPMILVLVVSLPLWCLSLGGGVLHPAILAILYDFLSG